jgi:hypothetical protein
MNLDIIFCISMFVFLASCSSQHEKVAASDGGSNATSAVPGFATIQAEILNRGSAGHCVDCHSQYSVYANVRLELVAIANSVQLNRMPKSGGPLSDNLKQLLQKWLEAGAPENPGQTPEIPPPPIRVELNWKSISDNIISPRCLICHNPQGQAKFLDLSTRQAMYSARGKLFGIGAEKKKLLDLDIPKNSYLLNIIQDPDEPMPPAWSNIRRLTTAEVQLLSDWIGLGLP